MPNRRQSERQLTIDNDVRTVTTLPNGAVLEGMVENYSLGGMRIAGPSTGMSLGDLVEVVFVFLTNERVRYEGRVVHLDPNGQYFGVEFLSEPQRIETS